MIEDIFIIIIPKRKKAGWKQAKWAILLIIASAALVIPITLEAEKLGIKGWGILGIIAAGLLIPPLITRVTLWHLFVKQLAKRGNTPKRPKATQAMKPAHELTPEQLENEIAWTLETVSPNLRAELTGGIGDDGIDAKLYDQSGMLRIIVQVKRLRPDTYCKPTHLRDLDSCRRRLGVAKALLATSGKFSRKTQSQAQEWKITLWDGEMIERRREEAYSKAAKVQIIAKEQPQKE